MSPARAGITRSAHGGFRQRVAIPVVPIHHAASCVVRPYYAGLHFMSNLGPPGPAGCGPGHPERGRDATRRRRRAHKHRLRGGVRGASPYAAAAQRDDTRTEPMKEETLDPADWDAMRALGHRMVDEMMDYLSTVRDRPAWQPVPTSARDALRRPLPRHPEGAEQAYEDFVEHVLPYPLGNIHPRFWGWVIGTGTPLGALADMLAAVMNPNVGGGDHGANYVERQVLEWCREIFGLPAGTSGILVSGGSMANLVGLAVARNEGAGYDVSRLGGAASPAPFTLYGSSGVHSSIQKAVELLGFWSEALRLVPVNAGVEVDVDALERMIAEDRAAGRLPLCVIGNAGTVNTGAIDDLARLADLCARERLWFHVDDAIGSLAVVL